jgi:hypothetical protein
VGVEYKSSAAYGMNVMGDPPRWTHEEWYDGDVDAWLMEQGFGLLATDTGGNSWSGAKRWSIIAKGSLVRVNEEESVAGLATPYPEAVSQLHACRVALWWGDAEIGWWVYFDVF